jgi:hypothetical protein
MLKALWRADVIRCVPMVAAIRAKRRCVFMRVIEAYDQRSWNSSSNPR